MKPLNRVLVTAAGAALTLGGLSVWLGGGISLPTRSPSIRFHFAGAPLLLLGASPLVLGATLLALGLQAIEAASRGTRWAIGAGIVLLGLAFFLAPKS